MTYSAPYETSLSQKWDFNKSSAAAAVYDYYGSVNLAVGSAPTPTQLNSGAYYFLYNGTSNYHTAGSAHLLNGTAWSVEFALKYDSSNANPFFARDGVTSTNYGWNFFINGSGHLELDSYSAGTKTVLFVSTTTLTTGNWYHLVLTYKNSGTRYTLYVNGGSADTGSTNAAAAANETNTYTVNVNRDGITSTNYGKQALALVRIWKTVTMSAANALVNYNAENWRWTDSAITAKTRILFDNPTGLIVSNQQGAGYNNLNVSTNRYATNPSTGAPLYTGVTSSDNQYNNSLPSELTNNITGAVTLEWIIYPTNIANQNNFLYAQSRDDTSAGFQIYYDTGGQLYINRPGASGSASWHPTSGGAWLQVNTFYHIQITWDFSVQTSTPVLYINNVNIPLTAGSNNASGGWGADQNYATGMGSSVGDIYLFQVWNAALNSTQLSASYNAEHWRYTAGGSASWTQTLVPNVSVATVAPTIALGVAQGTPPNVAVATVAPTIGLGVTQGTPPNVAVAIVAPTISASSNIVQGTPPNVAIATIAPTIGVGVSPASINVAVALVSPTVGIGVTQGTPPNVAVAIVAPTISASSNIVISTVPNVAVATVAPTVALAITQGAPPNVSVALVAPTVGIAISPSAPDVAVAIVSPIISASSNIVLGTPPDVAVTLLSPTIGIGITPASQDVAVALLSPTVGIGVTQTTVPDVSVSVIAPTISSSSNVVQTLVPDVTVATTQPTVGISVSQTTVPDVAVAIIMPIITTSQGTTWVQTVVPDVAVDVTAPVISIGITQVTVPDVAVQTHSPTVGITITPSVPDVRAAVVRPTVGVGVSQTTVPNVAVAVIMPVITIASSGSWTQTVVPDVTVDVHKPGIGIAITPSVPNVSATVNRPTIGVGVTQPTPPNVGVAVLLPIVTTETFNRYWTQVFVPDVTAQIVRPTVGIAVQPDSPDVAVEITQPTIDVGIKPPVPDVAVTIIKPIITIREFNPGSVVRLEGSSGIDTDLTGSDSLTSLTGTEDNDAELAGSGADVSLDGSSLDSVGLEGAR